MLYCLDQINGTLTWKYDCLSEVYSSPFVFENSTKIICASSDGLLSLFDLEGNVLDQKNLFSLKKSCFSTPLVYKNKIYMGSRDNFLYCLNFK